MIGRLRGKRNEIALAKRLGAKRLGTLGREDLSLGMFSIECKERKRLPVFLTKAYEQAKRNTPMGRFHCLSSMSLVRGGTVT